MKIFIAISFHGFGHLAQAAPLINALFSRHPDWQWVIQCSAGREQLARWVEPDFIHVQQATDLGIPMVNAVRADADATWHQYQRAYQTRDQDVAAVRQQLELHRPDLVLSNTSYWVSRAAAELNLPCFHFCSLNWADTFYAYCHARPDAAAIYQALCNDYNQGDVFFRLPPYMAMPGLQPLEDVGPVCRVGRKHDLHAHFGHAPTMRHVLVTMGGMPYPMPYERWPRRDDLFYLNAGPPAPVRPDIRNVADSGISHLDLVTSCDLVLTKPGYGTFLEAACAGTPILY
ncbi:MAG TPA: hypothetical protein VM553_06170, partial [Dongiaceae bacterium]|nr:hypothetical protein [Dongiaceae bacterium]